MTLVDGGDFLANILNTEDTPAVTPAPAQTTLQFQIKQFILKILLEKAATVVSSRDVMEVLKNFQFDVQQGRLRVIASDLELSMIATTEMVTVTTPGIAVFPARKMLDIVREADDGDVSIQVAGGTATITVGRTSWSLRLQGGHDYPPMPVITEVTFAAIDRAAFLTALQAVRYAVCKDTTRGSLMMIDVHDGRMTACDGSRFQQAGTVDFPFDFRIPIGALDDLLRLLRISDLDFVSIGESRNHLIFKLGADVFICNKLVAQFPDMEAMLLRPALANKHRLTVDRRALRTAVKRVRINADPETSAIALTLAPGELTVTARDKYNNTAAETIEAGWTGTERTVVLNHAFLTDMLTAHTGETCEFKLGDDTKSRKAAVMLLGPGGTVGLVQQMNSGWVGQ